MDSSFTVWMKTAVQIFLCDTRRPPLSWHRLPLFHVASTFDVTVICFSLSLSRTYQHFSPTRGVDLCIMQQVAPKRWWLPFFFLSPSWYTIEETIPFSAIGIVSLPSRHIFSLPSRWVSTRPLHSSISVGLFLWINELNEYWSVSVNRGPYKSRQKGTTSHSTLLCYLWID